MAYDVSEHKLPCLVVRDLGHKFSLYLLGEVVHCYYEESELFGCPGKWANNVDSLEGEGTSVLIGTMPTSGTCGTTTNL